MKLNKEEILVASILTMLAAHWLTWIITVPLCAFLWALTGSESKYNYKLWRRLGVPLVWALSLWTWQALICVPIAFGFLSIGYGMPSTQPIDDGSWLGRNMLKLFRDYNTANIITRAIIYWGAISPFLVVKYT